MIIKKEYTTVIYEIHQTIYCDIIWTIYSDTGTCTYTCTYRICIYTCTCSFSKFSNDHKSFTDLLPKWLCIYMYITDVNKSIDWLAYWNMHGKFTKIFIVFIWQPLLWYSLVQLLIGWNNMFTSKQHISNKIEIYHKLYITCIHACQSSCILAWQNIMS